MSVRMIAVLSAIFRIGALVAAFVLVRPACAPDRRKLYFQPVPFVVPVVYVKNARSVVPPAVNGAEKSPCPLEVSEMAITASVAADPSLRDITGICWSTLTGTVKVPREA